MKFHNGSSHKEAQKSTRKRNEFCDLCAFFVAIPFPVFDFDVAFHEPVSFDNCRDYRQLSNPRQSESLRHPEPNDLDSRPALAWSLLLCHGREIYVSIDLYVDPRRN
jgi:hypothetical protein